MGTRRILIGCGFSYAAAVSTPAAVAAVPDQTEEADQDAPECEPDALPAGWGRDASDVAMATIFGGPLLESMLVQAEEDPAGKELDDARRLGALRSGARPPRA